MLYWTSDPMHTLGISPITVRQRITKGFFFCCFFFKFSFRAFLATMWFCGCLRLNFARTDADNDLITVFWGANGEDAYFTEIQSLHSSLNGES